MRIAHLFFQVPKLYRAVLTPEICLLSSSLPCLLSVTTPWRGIFAISFFVLLFFFKAQIFLLDNILVEQMRYVVHISVFPTMSIFFGSSQNHFTIDVKLPAL